MTHVVALSGQWEGLRAIPRTLRTPDHRKRLEDGLERLGGLFEQMALRAALLTAGMERLNGLRSSMIEQLDALDGDADFEPWLGSGALGGDDREDDTCDHGEPDDDGEPSLSAPIALTPSDQTGLRWIGGGQARDLESEHDGREPDVDDEPDSDSEASLCGVVFGAPRDDGDSEATVEYGDDQTQEPRTTRWGPIGKSAVRAVQRPRLQTLTVQGPPLPAFTPEGWRIGVVRDGRLVIS
jgi:hypothetical protein